MTQQTPDTIHLQANSGREWSLTPVRPLSPSVQLTKTATSTYALKTLTLRSEAQIKAAVDDASIWRRVCAADNTNILNFHDVAVDPPRVYYIMEYCPGGDLSAVRNESSALRCLAAVAAGLEVVVSKSQLPAHANLSSKHILLDASGTPKLAGWGFVRARRLSNPNRKLTERDDVRALAAILYQMLYGKRFDADNLKLPETPQVSRLTADLLRNILYVKLKDVPELTVFRYDIAAARGLVPACTSALEPIVNKRREEILDLDLNSTRGLEPSQQTPVEGPEHSVGSKQSFEASKTSHEKPVEHDEGRNSPQPEQITQLRQKSELQAPNEIDLTSKSGIDHAVRRITKGNMESMRVEELEYLVDSCVRVEDLAVNIYNVLFRLPISKSPLVAFKAITFIHQLISEGPANLTALAIANDDFLNWIESSWSRDRLQNNAGKVHMYSYCFSVGEISWYTAVLRKRIEVHGRFAQVFSTHWVARPDGLSSLKATRRDIFRLILGVIEKSSSLLRKITSAKDPAASVKQGAVPMLSSEIWKGYHAICWLYATADDSMKPHLHRELELAHGAARSATEAVKAVPTLAASCVPNSILDLPVRVPHEFDTDALLKILKKKKKKRRKNAMPSNSKAEAPGSGIDAEKLPRLRSGDSETTREVKEPTSETAHEELKSKGQKGKREKRKEKLEKVNGTDRDLPQLRKAAEDTNSRQRAINAQSDVPSNEQTGLRKVSLSVRRDAPKGSHGRDTAITVPDCSSNEDTTPEDSGVSSGSKPPGTRRGAREKPILSQGEESSESDEETDTDMSTANGASIRAAENPMEKRKRPKYKKRKELESESDSEEERISRSKSRTKDRKKREKYAKKSGNSAESESSEEEEAARPRKPREKRTKPRHVDEKSIPFDREHPSRRRGTKPENQTRLVGGSKEALAAAARGRKTPTMNPKFEVMPYEVHFGPQIGSGGFGVVYKAKFRNETVAVKKIHSHALSNAASVGEFQSEVAVLCTLRHPNILRFVGACTKPPNLMIITEFMARGTLFDLLHQSDTRVTWPMRKKVAIDTCHGMRYLHDSKLLHRDLKSSNLMLDKDFNCKVGDFGLTRISKGSSAVQMTGQCGTFQYMAVEVLANKPYSEKADVFSFGVLLWEMVARKLPYFGMQPMQVGIAVLQQGMRPTIPPKCPEPLAKLMRACWDSDPNRRPSFAQLITALEAMPE